ncbi:hypothetical protein TRFO_22856 [Tritrichomonas foetus]|uniref:Uncharacterized protein n=1 Tax=Tritrichomonas foetus TaxID=1144522 RepID=A0A1J4KGX4_9EUKA|nr:hypothetical protein TRFO_22856 [Tritrichomonas foetus]|eukprot:OHT08589.1 hypothetical protein TRFO_22856 [Tritrichomonas foetus]
MPKQKEIKPSMNISQNLQPTQNQTQQFNYYNTMQQQQQNNFYQQTQQQMHQYISQPLPIQTPSQTIVNQAPKKVKTEPQPQVQQQQIDYPFSFSENEPNTVQNDENEVKAEDEMDFWSEMFNNTFEQGCEYDAFGWM